MSKKAKAVDKTRQKKAKDTKKEWSLWRWLLTAATLIGGLAALTVFLPRPTVSVSDPVDSNNPFSAAFTITNSNFVPLRDVSVMVRIRSLDFGDATKVNGGGTLAQSTWLHHDLGSDERFTVSLSDLLAVGPATPYDSTYKLRLPPDGVLQKGDIGIVITYKLLLVPWSFSKEYRFRSYRQTNGEFSGIRFHCDDRIR